MAENSKGSKGRRVLSWVLLVLGAVLAPLAVVMGWSRNLVLDTDRYVATVAPLAESTAIQNAAVDRAVETFADNVDVQTALEQYLPERLAFLAPVITEQVETAVATAAGRVVRSDAFADIWEEANRAVHPQVEALLTGKDEGVILVDEGAVVVNINGVLVEIRDRLAERLEFLANVPVEDFALNITLIQSDDLAKVQDGVDLLDRVADLLPWVAVALFVASVFVHPRRRRATLRVGVALAVGMVVLLALVRVGRWRYLDALPSTVDQAAAADIFDILTRFLREGLRVLILVGILVALVAAAFGDTGLARGVRSALGRHRWIGVGAVVALGVAILAIMEAPSPGTVLFVGGLTLGMVIAVLAMGRAPAEPSVEDPEAGRPLGVASGSDLPPPPPPPPG